MSAGCSKDVMAMGTVTRLATTRAHLQSPHRNASWAILSIASRRGYLTTRKVAGRANAYRWNYDRKSAGAGENMLAYGIIVVRR